MGNKKGKILLIEDNPDHVELMTLALEEYQVEVCKDSNTCFELMGSGHHDLILIDYSLPDTNGLELLETIKRKGVTTPVIFITGQGDERIAAEAIKAGAKDYIVKSRETLSQLPEIVQQYMGESTLNSTGEGPSGQDVDQEYEEMFRQIQYSCNLVVDKTEKYFNIAFKIGGEHIIRQLDGLIEHVEKVKEKLESVKAKLKKE